MKNKQRIKDLLKRIEKLEKHNSDNTEVSLSNELTELPEKWCVRDCKEVTDFVLTKHKDWGKDICEDLFYHFSHDKDIEGFHEIILENFTEITFEQFKKWVLKEEPETKKPISIRDVQVKVTSQEEANECAEIAKACGEKIGSEFLILYSKYANIFREDKDSNNFGTWVSKDDSKTEIIIQEFRELFSKPKDIDWSKAGQLVVDLANRTYILTDGKQTETFFSGMVVGGDLWKIGRNDADWGKKNFKICTQPITLSN